MKLVTLTTDFAVQSQSVGVMEATILAISPHVKVVHLMHGLPSYNITAAARTLESLHYVPIGYHVCVCDPGVGTSRKGIVIRAGRGDYLIGPDNGVLIPATRLLGGILQVCEIRNASYMNLPVSPIFHGRDIFAPAAAYLAAGVKLEEFGPHLRPESLMEAPYFEGERIENSIIATVIQINKFGSLHLNIQHANWDSLGLSFQDRLILHYGTEPPIELQVCNTFGDVPEGDCLIIKDDYGRIEVAINRGSFAEKFKISIGDKVELVLNN